MGVSFRIGVCHANILFSSFSFVRTLYSVLTARRQSKYLSAKLKRRKGTPSAVGNDRVNAIILKKLLLNAFLPPRENMTTTTKTFGDTPDVAASSVERRRSLVPRYQHSSFKIDPKFVGGLPEGKPLLPPPRLVRLGCCGENTVSGRNKDESIVFDSKVFSSKDHHQAPFPIQYRTLHATPKTHETADSKK